MSPPPPPPCRWCKWRCASSLATGTLFSIYFRSGFLHAAVTNYMKLVTTILFLVLSALMHRVYIILLFANISSHAMWGQNSTSWPETLWPLRLLGAPTLWRSRKDEIWRRWEEMDWSVSSPTCVSPVVSWSASPSEQKDPSWTSFSSTRMNMMRTHLMKPS